MADIITGPGYYKMRNGKKAYIVGKKDPALASDTRCWIGHCATEYAVTWQSNGSYFEGEMDSTCGVDIVSVWREPVKVSGWVNVYTRNELNTSRRSFHSTKAEALSNILDNPIATIYVSGVEGEEPAP